MASPQKAGEEADRLIAQLTEQRKAVEGKPQAEPVVSVDPVVQSEQSATQPEGDAGTQSDVGVQTNTPQGDPDALTLARKEIASANARWQSLQGMVNKKDSEIEQMRLLLAQLSQKAEQPAAQPAAPLVTEKDAEEFGADMVDMVSRVASDTFNTRIKAVYDAIARMEKSIAGVSDATTQIAAETFDEALTRQVPNWATINNEPEFLAWLNEEEGFTGRTKLELLQDAYRTGNLKLTVRFFKAFEELKKPASETTPQATTPASNVAKFVSPGKAKSTATPQVAQAQSKVWSSGDISKLYDDKRNKRITEEEFVKQENDLFTAQREGRIAA